MNEEALQQAFETDDAEQAKLAEEEAKNQEVEQEEVQLSALELEAQKMGHTSKEEFVEKGGDPERWKTPHEYIEYGKLKSALDKSNARSDQLEAKFDARVDNLNKLHKAQTDAKIKALKKEQRQAVDEADTDKFDSAQQEIDDLESSTPEEPTETPTGKDPAVLAWEAKNPWINDNKDPRAQIAVGLWNGFCAANQNSSPQEALDYIDKQMDNMGHQTNTRRDSPSTTERNAPSTKNKGGKITMDNLTPDERDLWKNAGFDLWGNDEKAFLQSVKDSRKVK